MARMATMKRRVIYLSDEEWAAVKDAALEADITASMWLRQVIVAVGMGLNVQRPLRPMTQADRDAVLRKINKGAK